MIHVCLLSRTNEIGEMRCRQPGVKRVLLDYRPSGSVIECPRLPQIWSGQRSSMVGTRGPMAYRRRQQHAR
jgi:hypothetical protein